MPTKSNNNLTINGGSLSIKFSVFATTDPLQRGLAGKLDRIGQPESQLTFNDPVTGMRGTSDVVAADNAAAVEFLVDWLESQNVLASVAGIGHRVVAMLSPFLSPRHVGSGFEAHSVLVVLLKNVANNRSTRGGT